MKLHLLTLILISIPLALSAQQKCESLFADVSPEKIVQELAHLSVDRDDAAKNGNGFLLKTLNKVYLQKYTQAQRSGMDLSLLPQAIHDARNKDQQQTRTDEARHDKAREAELDLSPWQVRQSFKGLGGPIARFSPDGNIIAATLKADIELFDLNKGQVVQTLPVDTALYANFEFSPDGTKLIASAWNKSVAVWDVRNGKRLHSIKTGNSISRVVSFSPDSSKMYWISETPDGKSFLQIADVTSAKIIMELEQKNLNEAQMSPDGTKVVLVSKREGLSVWDLSTKTKIASEEIFDPEVDTAKFSADGKTLYVKVFKKPYALTDRSFTLWDTSNWQKIFESPHYWDPQLSPDGHKIAFTIDEHHIRVWDIPTRTLAHNIEIHEPLSYSGLLSFSPDGKQVILGNQELKTVGAWKLDSETKVFSVGPLVNNLFSVQMNSTGARFMTIEETSDIKVWQKDAK